MSRQLTGAIIANKMNNTVIVELVRKAPHPLYKKLLKKNKRIKADTKEIKANLGEIVEIRETRPLSKDKHFKVVKVVKKGEVARNGSA